MNSIMPESKGVPITETDLFRRYQALQVEVQDRQKRQRLVWSLLAAACQRLQISSSSVKAAVSSLLSYGFFWDDENQNDFLETIDSSIDQVNHLAILIILVLRSEAGNLELKPEPHLLQEILYKVQEDLSDRKEHLTLIVNVPNSGQPVLVDYLYLSMALKFVLEAASACHDPATFTMNASEQGEEWILEIQGISPIILDSFREIAGCKSDHLSYSNVLSPENYLLLYTVSRILCKQGISVLVNAETTAELTLRIPCATDPTNDID